MIFESQKKSHSWTSSYLDAQQIKLLDTGEFHLLTYQDRKWRLGADREYHLRVSDKEFPSHVAPLLEQRLGPRFVSGFADAEGKVLWEVPAKHLLRLSGTEGMLIVAQDRIVYRTDRPGASRTWFFSDIDSITTSGRFQLTITTTERSRAHYGNLKGFSFQLKEPLTEAHYDDLWRRIEKSKGLEILTSRWEEQNAR